MPQVIEVKFVNSGNGEVIHDSMTLAKTHEEAINLAMGEWSAGAGKIKETHRIDEPPKWIGAPGPCWRYMYRCVVEDDEYDREMIAVLFAQYKLKEEVKE